MFENFFEVVFFNAHCIKSRHTRRSISARVKLFDAMNFFVLNRDSIIGHVAASRFSPRSTNSLAIALLHRAQEALYSRKRDDRSEIFPR